MSTKSTNILGIETSCDESAMAIFSSEHGLLAHHLHSQVELHKPYGGVVPELASRDHVRKMVPLLRNLLDKANLKANDIDGVAYTAGPGLLGALLVGAAFARSLAFGWGVPSIGIHHLEAHLLAVMLEDKKPKFPFVALLVSGGHTLLLQVESIGNYHILGETLDDAAGEAFDKTARLLELPYATGAEISKIASQVSKHPYHFPRPMIDRPGLDFSFSGLKTFTRNTWQKSDQSTQTKAEIACAFEEAVADTLAIKCRRALEKTGYDSLVVAGGVAANQHLRKQLQEMTDSLNAEIFFPRHEFCTDNGAMVAYTGYQRLLTDKADALDISVRARWPLATATTEKP